MFAEGVIHLRAALLGVSTIALLIAFIAWRLVAPKRDPVTELNPPLPLGTALRVDNPGVKVAGPSRVGVSPVSSLSVDAGGMPPPAIPPPPGPSPVTPTPAPHLQAPKTLSADEQMQRALQDFDMTVRERMLECSRAVDGPRVQGSLSLMFRKGAQFTTSDRILYHLEQIQFDQAADPGDLACANRLRGAPLALPADIKSLPDGFHWRVLLPLVPGK